MKTLSCSQCGECCRWLVLGERKEMSADEIRYYTLRGAVERQGLLLVEHPCTMLEYFRAEDGAAAGAGEVTDENLAAGIIRARCSVHGEKPAACRLFDGKKRRNGTVFYVPEKCTMAAGKRGRERKPGE
jgi:Fe-S-cluster containining protein